MQRWILVAILALVMIPSGLLGYANAQAVNIVVGRDSVTLNMTLAMQENLTTLPLINAHVSLANSTAIIQPFLQVFSQAIQSRVTNARLSNLDFRIRISNNTGTWLMDENYSLTVTGVNMNSGSNIESDLDFISMSINQSMQVGIAETNSVGPTYLLPALQAKAAAYSNLVYYIDGSNPRTPVIPEETTRVFWLLDFSWVAPISTWTSTKDILGQSSQWTLDLAGPLYNLTLALPSPEGPPLARYDAIYSPSMKLTVPANAWVNGNKVSFDLPAPAETAMPVIIAASATIALATVAVDRKLTGAIRARKKR